MADPMDLQRRQLAARMALMREQASTGTDAEPMEIDSESGAPARVRMAVGRAKSFEDKVATARNHFPDARPMTFGGERLINGVPVDFGAKTTRIVYTDPKSKKLTVLDPAGADLGDVAELVPAGIRMVTSAIASARGGTPAAQLWGGVGGSQAADMGMEALMDPALGVVDSRGPGEWALSRLADAGVEAGGTALGAKLTNAPLNVIRHARYGRGVAGSPQILNDLTEMAQQVGEPQDTALRGAAPLVSRNDTVQKVSNALRVSPGSSGIMRDAIDKTMGVVRRYADDVARRLGPSQTRQDAGDVLHKGIAGFVDRATAKSGGLYTRLNRHFADGERVALPNTVASLKEKLEKFKGLPNIQGDILPSKFQGYLQDITAKKKGVAGMSWTQLQEFRAYVGKMSSDGRLITDIPRGEWKQLYGTLSSDMEEAAARKGPEALSDFTRANKFYRGLRERTDDFLNKVVNNEETEKAFGAAFSGDKSGATRLTVLKKSLKPDEWNDLVGVKLREMGLETAGAGDTGERLFSPTTFLKNYRSLSDEAKGVVFGGARLRTELDRLVRVSEAVKETAGMFNTSNTASTGLFMRALEFGGAGGVITAAATFGDPGAAMRGAAAGVAVEMGRHALRNSQAKLLTNPDFVRWLANGAKLSVTNYAGVGAHVGRLVSIAKLNPEISDEIHQYMGGLQNYFPTTAQRGGQ